VYTVRYHGYTQIDDLASNIVQRGNVIDVEADFYLLLRSKSDTELRQGSVSDRVTGRQERKATEG